jgi:hypothetical protein
MKRKATPSSIDRRTPVTGMAAVPALVFTQGAFAQQNQVTAIDIAIEPDATMVQHAKDANARLLKSFSKGFALDETHHPHISILQQFVRTNDLDRIFAASNSSRGIAAILNASETPRRTRRPANLAVAGDSYETTVGQLHRRPKAKLKFRLNEARAYCHGRQNMKSRDGRFEPVTGCSADVTLDSPAIRAG